jgi:hypothetical protein
MLQFGYQNGDGAKTLFSEEHCQVSWPHGRSLCWLNWTDWLFVLQRQTWYCRMTWALFSKIVLVYVLYGWRVTSPYKVVGSWPYVFHIHRHSHTRTHTHMHTYIRTYIHTCIHAAQFKGQSSRRVSMNKTGKVNINVTLRRVRVTTVAVEKK